MVDRAPSVSAMTLNLLFGNLLFGNLLSGNLLLGKNATKQVPRAYAVRSKPFNVIHICSGGLWLGFACLVGVTSLGLALTFDHKAHAQSPNSTWEQGLSVQQREATETLNTFLTKILTEVENGVDLDGPILETIRARFDTLTVARFVLGRTGRGKSRETLQRFRESYEALMLRSYARRLNELKGADYKIFGAEPVGKRDVRVQIEAKISGKQPFQMGFRMRDSKSEWKIIDMYILGVSMASTQRKEIQALLGQYQHNVDAVSEYLETLLTELQ